MHRTQLAEIFNFYAILYHTHPLTSAQNITEIVPGKPLRRRLNAREVANYSDVIEPVEGYFRNGAKYGHSYATDVCLMWKLQVNNLLSTID